MDLNYYYYHHHHHRHRHYGSTRWSSWLRHWATNRKVAARFQIYIGIFHWHNPFGRTMALVSTQPLTQMSTRNISWGGKCVRFVGLKTSPHSLVECQEIWEPQSPGTLRACPGLYRDGLPFSTIISTIWCGVNWYDICGVSYGEVLGDKSTIHIRMTLYWGYLIVLWLFYLLCIL
jgi:hypothetical protein